MNLDIRVIDGNKHTVVFHRNVPRYLAQREWDDTIRRNSPCKIEREPLFAMEHAHEFGEIRIKHQSTLEQRVEKLEASMLEGPRHTIKPSVTRHEISIPTRSVTAASKIITVIGENAACTQARIEHVNENLCYAKVTVWI